MICGDDKRIFTLKSIDTPKYGRLDLGTIYGWASRFDSTYGVMSNNCQDLVNKFFIDFYNTIAHDPSKATWDGIDTTITVGEGVTTIVALAADGCCLQ